MAAGKKPVEQAVEMVIKTDKHEYWLGHDAHALIAHVRLAGKAFQLSLGIALEDISGTGRDCTGARTPADVIILALARRAGWEVQRTDGALGEGDTPNAKAAAGYNLNKRSGRPAGSKAPVTSTVGKAKVAAKVEAKRLAAITRLQKAWRARRGRFTSRGTAIVAPKAAAIVELQQFAAFVGGCACSTCGACLRVDKKKSLQIGVAAQWAVVCTGAACTALPRLLHTCAQHAAPWADDFIINTKMHFASVTCAVDFSRANDLLRLAGLGCLSNRGQYRLKEELEGPAAHMVEAKMAAAYAAELARPPTALPRCLMIDAFWDHGRNGTTAVMPFMSSRSGRIVHIESARKKEDGVKSSNELEQRCFAKGLRNPRIASDAFGEIAMDGAKQLVKATEAAHKRASGDGWHHGKCRVKGFRGHVEGFVVRPKPTAVEKEAKEAKKLPKPQPAAKPPELKWPKLAAVTLADARSELEGVGVVLDASTKEEAVRKMHTALVKARHVQLELKALVARYQSALCGEVTNEEVALHHVRGAAVSACVIEVPLSAPEAALKQLTRAFGDAAACSVATAAELESWKLYFAYASLQRRAELSREGRKDTNKDIRKELKEA